MAISKRQTPTGKTRWVARYRDHAGKEHAKTFTTQKLAKAFLQEQQRALRRGEWVNPVDARMTVTELFEAWVNSAQRRPSTVDKYRATAKNLGPLGSYPAVSVSQQDLSDWLRQLVEGRPWHSGKPLGESTARAMSRHLRSAFSWAQEQGMVGRNPVVTPKAATSQTVLPEDIPTAAEITAVIDCVNDGEATYWHKKDKRTPQQQYTQGPYPVVADMMRVAVLTGLRISELCGLVVGDIDLVNGVVKVRWQVNARGDRVPLKTSRSRRDIPVSAELAPILQMLVIGRPAGDFLFTTDRGRPWAVSRVSVVVKRAREYVGAPSVHFHALRHFFASSLLSSGVPVHEVSAVLGHSSAVLLSTYAHVLPGSMERTRSAISSAVGCGLFADSVGDQEHEKTHLPR